LSAASAVNRLERMLHLTRTFEHLGFDPYVEHGKMIGEDPDFLRELYQRRGEIVVAEEEERAAKSAATNPGG
jgi:hypothetical protein